MKFRELSGMLCMRGVSLRMKGVVYKACVRSMLTYGAETWEMTAGVFQRLRATEYIYCIAWKEAKEAFTLQWNNNG